MKKNVCIILACFLLVMTPIKGYASSAPLVFGLGEEVILPFLLSLLGVQSVNQIDSYDDLVSYNDEVYGSLTESLSGLASFEVIQEWILKACQGLIQTDSIVWQKIKELALANYIVSQGGGVVNSTTVNNVSIPFFNYVLTDRLVMPIWTVDGIEKCAGYGYLDSSGSRSITIICSSTSQFSRADGSYTYDGKKVYYYRMAGQVSAGWQFTPSLIDDASITMSLRSADAKYIAWAMQYEGVISQANIAEYSSAFDMALTAQQKDDIVDGTAVIQLYNPADEQNGLHFVPDPEEPNDIKIPFAVTADWWNYLKQFGNDAKEQVVQAYNALNGLNGNSIGSISDAYDSLGIASVLSTAQSAAEGIASLTDSNVYPNSLTVADAINNSVPSSLLPETPDSGIDNESEQGLYKLPDLRDYFPFCIPFDLIDLLSCFVAEPETPSFVIALSTGEETVSGNMDLHIWDNIAGVIRTFELIGFTVGLILITRNIIRG